ncbi:MAG: hypothetical protein ACPGRX_00205 [Bdellovibrionales bacterium]
MNLGKSWGPVAVVAVGLAAAGCASKPEIDIDYNRPVPPGTAKHNADIVVSAAAAGDTLGVQAYAAGLAQLACRPYGDEQDPESVKAALALEQIAEKYRKGGFTNIVNAMKAGVDSVGAKLDDNTRAVGIPLLNENVGYFDFDLECNP